VSGKNVSLYTGLNILNTDARNIFHWARKRTRRNYWKAVIRIQREQQVRALALPRLYERFLRQDPDVIMVDEIQRRWKPLTLPIKRHKLVTLCLSTLTPTAPPKQLNPQ